MNIKILGTGCSRCDALEQVTRKAVSDLGIKASFQKVDDILEIMSYGIMHTPGLVVNNKVVMSGRVPSVTEIKELLV